ncbi:thrombomodulin [Bombina bombina]|uniref:thrombomodulin n=1 Tax=Bombina bombina TaxID=8345 RepID=UPI00235B26A0|nr:thrombomodulin [Bombina bombina]
MRMLLQTIFEVVLFSQLVYLAPTDQQSLDIQPINEKRYSMFWSSKEFKGAKKSCKKMGGKLMTVRNSVEADILSLFLQGMTSSYSVWIGLEQPNKDKCTDTSLKLRGYKWITGDTNTDYTNWMSNEVKCDKHCVSVQENGAWKETSCNDRADGFLCEFSTLDTCQALDLPVGFSASYVLPIGMVVNNWTVLPLNTTASITNVQSTLICTNKGDNGAVWDSDTLGPWPCEIENGGCDYKCHGAVCSCIDGTYLKEDARSCSPLPTPCEPNPCAQQCSPDSSSSLGYICMCDEGYNLSEDEKSCQDIDDCKINPKICDHQCSNTIGGFECSCFPGYEMADGQCEDIDECLNPKYICEHDCNNYPGGYNCSCSDGYIVDAEKPNKCKLFCNKTACNAECNLGVVRDCRCPDGFILDDSNAEGEVDYLAYDQSPLCLDIDECDTEICKHTCLNLLGGYQCVCPEGYILQEDTSCLPEHHDYTMQPAMLLGISVVILSMVTVLIGIICRMVRKHYTEQTVLDYKCKGSDKGVMLQQVKSGYQQNFNDSVIATKAIYSTDPKAILSPPCQSDINVYKEL